MADQAASPIQVEHGHSRIAHPILEAMAAAGFTAAQYAVLLVLVRETYGWSRRDAQVSLGAFITATRLHKTTVQRALQPLIDEGVTVVVEPATFSAPAVYRIQKDPRKWGKYSVTPSSLSDESGQAAGARGGSVDATRGGSAGATRGGSVDATSQRTQPVESAEVAGPQSKGIQEKAILPSNNPGAEGAERVELDPVGDRLPTEQPLALDGDPDVIPLRGVRATPTESKDEFVRRAIILANRGMADNPALPPTCTPIPTGHGASVQQVHDWLAEGIPREAIERAVYEAAKRYKPDNYRQRITSLRYFNGAVREEADRMRAAHAATPQRRESNDNEWKPAPVRAVSGDRYSTEYE